MKKEKNVWAITLIVLWWLTPSMSKAQQDSLFARHLDEVVVTATRFPKNQSETGKVLTVIDHEQLERNAGKDLSQILNEQVGMNVNGANSNPGKDKSVYLRGATNSYTLVLLDGVPLNDPSGVSGGAYDLRLLSVNQIERIEILKGSQSTLYGSDAIAGVINIITKKGGEKPLGGMATASYGSYGTFKAIAGVMGSTQVLDYNADYTHTQSEGISEAKDPTGSGIFDQDGYDQTAFQTSLAIHPMAGLFIKPFTRYSKFNGKYDAGASTDDTYNKYEASLFNAGANVQYQLKKGAINLLYGYDKSNRTYDDSYGRSEYEGRFSNTDLFLNHDLGKNFQMLAGLNFQRWMMLDSTATIKDPDINLTSGYLSLFARNMGGFFMEVGGRANHHSKYSDNFTYTVNPSYLFGTQFKTFLNYSTGYKAPTLYQLYGLYGANAGLKPEKSSTLEGGVQWYSSDKKIDIRAIAFSRRVKDVIIYSIGPLGNGVNTNFDQQNDHGFEIEPSFRPTDKLTIRAFYAFVTGEVKTRTYDNRDTTYNNLIRRPKNSFGVNLAYAVSRAFSLSANLKAFGERKDIYFDLATFENKTATLAAYTLLDLHADYKFAGNKVNVFLDVRNLLNQDYEEVYGYSTMKTNFTLGAGIRL